MKKIIITEEQKETLVDKLLYMIDLHGFDVAVSTVGSVKNLVKVIGKDNFETVLIEHKFDPNEIQLVTSIYDVSDSFYMFGGVVRQKLMKYLNDFGPMFLLKIGGNRFLYQNQGNDEYFASEYDYKPMEDVLNYAGLTKLKIKDVITLFDDKIDEQY